jgi:hypothetical protein
MSRASPDLTNQRFGRLVALHKTVGDDRATWWMVRCDCGVAKAVRATPLVKGATRSCGCLRRETSAANRKRSGAAAYLAARRVEEATDAIFGQHKAEIVREEKTWANAEDAALELARLW